MTRRSNRRPLPQVLSYGGGLDSFCMLIDAIRRKDLPDAIVFMDVGDPGHTVPGEWPETYKHILEVAAPLARKHKIPFYWLVSGKPSPRLDRQLKKAGVKWQVYPIRGGGADESPSLLHFLERKTTIPVKGPNRICTTVAKVERFRKWLDDHYPGQVVDVWIGFEQEEGHRAVRGDPFSQPKKPKAGGANRINVYPLIKIGTKHKGTVIKGARGKEGLTRMGCGRLIQSSRLPMPSKSACTYCPYAKAPTWREFARADPAGFARIQQLERRKLAKPTQESGFRLSIQGWRRFELSPTMHALLVKLLKKQGVPVPRDAIQSRARPTKDHPKGRIVTGLYSGEHSTFESMEKMRWITPEGKLTNYGKDILKTAGPKAPASKTEGEFIVWKAARKGGKLPMPGVHYEFTPIGEFAACSLVDEDTDLQDMVAGITLPTRMRKNPELRRVKHRLLRN